MTTRYPADLPPVPDHRWAAARVGSGGDIDAGTAWADFEIDAAAGEQAERNLLAWIDHDFQDDLRGAVAEHDPARSPRPGRHLVRLRLAAPRG